MPRFFVEPFSGDGAVISGADAVHIARALRMRVGEELTLCDRAGTDYTCVITAIDGDSVEAKVLCRVPTESEPSTAVTLYQGLPKSEKMEWIIQKSVEIGVSRIVPLVMARSIVRLKPEDSARKVARWQKIAAEAAGQSGRGIVPEITRPVPVKQALGQFSAEPTVVFYEGGGAPLNKLVHPSDKCLSIVVGPEGGIDPTEIALMEQAGARTATLGKRILRCETAPLVALSVIMQLTGNMT